MPFILLFVGLLLAVTAYRGTTDELFTLLKGDFTGSGNFVYWVLALFIMGAIGYIDKLKPISDAMLVLVIIVLFLAPSNRGFFEKFTQAVQAAGGDAVQKLTDASYIQIEPSKDGGGLGDLQKGISTATKVAAVAAF